MKHQLIVIIAFVLMIRSGIAGLVCDSSVFDFGEREEGETIKHTFIVRNTGERAVVVERVKTTCGCTAATPSAKVVQAGGSIEIKAAINLKKRRGPQDKKIHIYSRDSDKRLELTLKGTSVPTIEIKPRFLFFGRVDPDKSTEKSITIRGLKKDLNPGTIRCESSYLSCSLDKGENENEYVLTGTLTTNLPAGEFRTTVYLPIYDQSEILSIPVYASVPSSLFVSPNMIRIQEAIADKPLQRIITLRPGKVKEFELLSVDCPDENASIKINPVEGGGYAVILANLNAGKLDGRSIIIKTTAQGAESIAIPFEIQSRESK